MDEPADNKPYYTKDYFLDIFGRKVLASELNNAHKYKVGKEEFTYQPTHSSCKMDKSGFQLWHVEYKEDPNVETGPSYIDLPMPNLRCTQEEYAEYNKLMELAWKHKPWHTSHQPEERPLSGLAQEVNQKLLDWKAKAPGVCEVSRKRFLVSINNVQRLLDLCEYGSARQYLESLKWDVTNAAFA